MSSQKCTFGEICKNIFNFLFLVCLFLSSICMIRGATTACRNKPLLFNFGDSNSDTGGASALQGTPLEFPMGRAFFHEPTGRICDGRLILDFLCESLGTKYLTPYLELFAPDFSNGVNFALAGSDTIRWIFPNVPFTLKNQVLEFGHFRNISLRRGLISAEQFRDNALYLIDIGQNDIDGNFDDFPFDRLLHSLIPGVIYNIKQAIQMIYGLGGRNFWVYNTGPLGCLPKNIAKKNASTLIDDYGCIAKVNEAAAKFNSELEKLCRELRSEMDDDATIVYVDVHSIKLDLILNFSSYGFRDSFAACYNEAARTVCSEAEAEAEAEGRRYVSWDGVHYTEAANMFVASKILSTNFSTPLLHFNFFCN